MKWTEIPAGEMHAAEQRLRVALGDKASEVVRKINSDGVFAGLAARIIIMMAEDVGNKPISLNLRWLRARLIMGRNIFGVEEAIEYFGINPSEAQLAALTDIPFSEETLKQCANTHILVAVFPLTIAEIRDKTREIYGGRGLISTFPPITDWYENQDFFKIDRGEVGWQLVRKTPVDKSTLSRGLSQQLDLISQDDEITSARVLVYTIIGHWLNRREPLFREVCVRTSTNCVQVGYFQNICLALTNYSNNYWGDGNDLGISSAKKRVSD